ncbi:MAG TPA: triose-phosphate isomerase [Terriglobales bacterium]|nr:triose-phosphate isomerase [Terriglobales bacterium]
MRRKLIAGNWKMYKTPDEARAFVREFAPLIANHDRDDVALFPPYVSIPATLEAVAGTRIEVGAQNMHWEKQGAYTGEVAAGMLTCIGCKQVIVGHSERRQYFGETDDSVNRKLRGAIADGLYAIVCIGEYFEERESGLTESILRRQVAAALREISSDNANKFAIAYEPVWAIGTGKTATPEMASEAHYFIRGEAAKAIGKDAADNLRILYGGSVKPENAHALMSQQEIDGGLVGGASLDPKSFAAIVKW